jgi:hypothetical protein
MANREGRQGRIVAVAGRDHGITCPVCGIAPVVYNGNYFCDRWDDGCDWALAHPATTKRDRDICDLIGIDHD